MKERVISGIFIGIIFAIVVYFGGIVFDLAACILAFIAYKELLDINKKVTIPVVMKIIGLLCIIALLMSNISDHTLIFGLSYETLSIVMICILAPAIFIKKYTSNDAFYLAFVVIFISTIFNLLINVFNASIYSFIYVVLVACVTDVFALFGGKLIGKHKLTPISPKKTIEGSIVGTLFAIIVCTTYYSLYIGSECILTTGFITFILSISGQIGDIFFSLIKRENDKKDYSNLIPGHGGILDRLDSIIFVLITYTFIIQFL